MSLVTRSLIALAIAILPINIIMIWYRLNQTENFTTSDMTIYPLLFGGGTILLILLLNKHLLKSDFRNTFNPGLGNITSDLGVGVLLTIVLFALFFLERVTLMEWIPRNSPPSTELIDVMRDLVSDPLLMVIWFGPVLWIGIALFEEMSRLFMLKCLWNLSDNRIWEIIAILLTSILIGAVHIYQGLAGAIGIGIQSVIMCWYFYKYKRIWPLVIAHGLYDGLQLLSFIIQFR